MRALLTGAVAGLGIAVPVGPVALLILERGMRHGLRSSLAAGLGAATADLAFAAVAAVAGVAAAELLAPVGAGLRVVAGLALAALAARGLWSLRSLRTDSAEPAATSEGAGGMLRTWSGFLGLTLLNPLTITYFTALVVGGTAALGSFGSRAAFVIGAFAASAAWQSLLAVTGSLLGARLPQRARLVTGIGGNLVVLALAVYTLAA